MGRPGELRRPIISEGPLKVLNEALHELHLAAGLPTLSAMHKELGRTISRSSLHDAFTGPGRPPWDTVEALVEILATRSPHSSAEEEAKRFHQLWVDAARSVIATSPVPPSRSDRKPAAQDLFWVIGTDVAGFGAADDVLQAIMRMQLYNYVNEALAFAGMGGSAESVDRGDSVLSLVPAEKSGVGSLLGFLLHLERLILEQAPSKTELKLRVAVSVGPLEVAEDGWFGSALNDTARLLDSHRLRDNARVSVGRLTVAVTSQIHEAVETYSPRGFHPIFKPDRVSTKEGDLPVWIYMMGVAYT
jgi:hypothetical protein